MKRFFRLPLLGLCLSIIVLPLTVPVFTGCQGTRTQQILFITTDSVGSAVDKAVDAFNDFEVQRAKQALGANATADTVLQWMLNDPSWKDVADKRDKFNAAFTAWTAGNAIAASGTNVTSAVSTAQFRAAAIKAANDLTVLISSFVPTVKVVQ